MVSEGDRLKSKDVVQYLQKLLDCNKAVGNPEDEIKVIFDKIQNWKEGLGNQQEQQVEVAKRLRPKERTNVLNVKSLEAILNEI